MAEPLPFAIGIGVSVGSTVWGDVGDMERSSAVPHVLSSWPLRRGGLQGIRTQPPGQGGAPAGPAECTARPSSHAVRMVSVAKTAVAHSHLEDGSTVATSRPCRRPEPTRGWAGKCDRWTGESSARERLTTRTVGYGPCAAAMRVGTLTDAHSRW